VKVNQVADGFGEGFGRIIRLPTLNKNESKKPRLLPSETGSQNQVFLKLTGG